MHPYRERPSNSEYSPGDLAWFRRPLGVFLLALFAGCVYLPHVEPAPRTKQQQYLAATTIESYCSDDVVMSAHDHAGQGVVISERHVLTAYHVVACPSIPRVYAFVDGFRHKMVVTREDPDADIARLEILHAGRFGLNIAPPMLGVMPDWDEVLNHGAPAGIVVRQGEPSRVGPLLPPDVFGVELEHGDSGAGVYDVDGGLVGLVRSRLDWADPRTNELRTATRITIVGATWLSGT